jgi:hypothetical protein
MPVSSAARDGEHTGQAQARVNVMPCDARRSMFVVT